MRGTPSPLEKSRGKPLIKRLTLILSLGEGGKELGLFDCTCNLQLQFFRVSCFLFPVS